MRSGNLVLSVLLAMFSVSAFAKNNKGAGFPEVSTNELAKLVETGKVTLLDNNSADTYKAGHIPTAIHATDTSKDQLATKLPADKSTLIVAYCGGVKCTAWKSAAEKAKELGYTNIKHYKQGINGWKDAGKPVEKG